MLDYRMYIFLITFLYFCGFLAYCDIQRDCGSKWQQEYTEFHKNALSSLGSSENHKYVISIAPPQGLSDRLSGFVTHFMFALLTNRVYLHVTPPNLPLLGDAYDVGHGNIDTNLFNHSPIVSFDAELFDLSMSGYKRNPNKNVYAHNYGLFLNAGTEMNSKQRINIRKHNKRLFTGSDFNKLKYSNRDRIIILGNRGFSYQMFENPHHNTTLYALGLTPDNAFKCVFHYLFKLREPKVVCSDKSEDKDNSNTNSNSNVLDCKGVNHNTNRSLSNRIMALQSVGDVVIGIHVRLGDHIFDRNVELTMLVNVHWYMKCALELKDEFDDQQNRSWTGTGASERIRKAYILFLSDSLDLRVEVLKKYGEGVILVSLGSMCVSE